MQWLFLPLVGPGPVVDPWGPMFNWTPPLAVVTEAGDRKGMSALCVGTMIHWHMKRKYLNFYLLFAKIIQRTLSFQNISYIYWHSVQCTCRRVTNCGGRWGTFRAEQESAHRKRLTHKWLSYLTPSSVSVHCDIWQCRGIRYYFIWLK